jgi:hypothetical protein
MLTRLGPSEIYALPAILFFVYGLIKNNSWMIFISYVVCVGGKENLLILLPILIGRVIYLKIQNKLTIEELVINGIAIAYTVFIALGIILATNKAGVDFYLNDISYAERMMATLYKLPEIIDNRHMLLPLLTFFLMSGYYIVRNKQVKLGKHILLGSMILVVALSQYVFYNNTLPTNSRYDFPALILFPVFDLVVAKMVITATKQHKWGKYIKLMIYIGLSIFMLAYIVKRGYVLIQNSARNNAANTAKFDANLRQATETALAHPEATIVFVSNKYFSFEPMISVGRFLTAKKVSRDELGEKNK